MAAQRTLKVYSPTWGTVARLCASRARSGSSRAAARGSGEATARGFAAEGGKAVLLGPEQGPLETVAGDIGGVAIVGDAADAGDVGRALAAAKDLGGLDVVITCAGGEGFGTLLDVPAETSRRTCA